MLPGALSWERLQIPNKNIFREWNIVVLGEKKSNFILYLSIIILKLWGRLGTATKFVYIYPEHSSVTSTCFWNPSSPLCTCTWPMTHDKSTTPPPPVILLLSTLLPRSKMPLLLLSFKHFTPNIDNFDPIQNWHFAPIFLRLWVVWGPLILGRKLLGKWGLIIYLLFKKYIYIWFSFLRTGIGSESCPFLKKVLKLAVTKREEHPLFFQLFMKDFF